MAVPQLSVIIPCYNNGPLLSEMINCILRQTYDDWELIVVDDGSTDDTPAIVGNSPPTTVVFASSNATENRKDRQRAEISVSTTPEADTLCISMPTTC